MVEVAEVVVKVVVVVEDMIVAEVRGLVGGK